MTRHTNITFIGWRSPNISRYTYIFNLTYNFIEFYQSLINNLFFNVSGDGSTYFWTERLKGRASTDVQSFKRNEGIIWRFMVFLGLNAFNAFSMTTAREKSTWKWFKQNVFITLAAESSHNGDLQLFYCEWE